MTDLRAQVVEAMAQAMYEAATGLDDWADEDEYEPENAAKTRDLAEAALDAALDVLGQVFDLENARPFSIAEEDAFAIRRLSKALRAGKGSDE